MIIALEALDGVGKSTIGPALAQRLGGIYFATPDGLFQEHRKMADTGSKVLRFFYYLAALQDASEKMKKFDGTAAIIIDRYVDSTFATHEAMGVLVNSLVNELQLDILRPDFTFYLYASVQERHRRLAGRVPSDYDRYLEADEALQLRTHQCFWRRGLINVDTTSLLVEETVELLASMVLKREVRHA